MQNTEERPWEDTARGSHLQVKERDPRKTNKPAGTLILDSLPPELWENIFLLLFKLPVSGILLWQPLQMNTAHKTLPCAMLHVLLS